MTLPQGWAEAKLDDFTVERVDQAEPGASAVPYIDIGSIDKDLKRVGPTKSVTGANAPARARQWVKAGDVLVSLTRPNLNAVALVTPELDGAVASTGFDVLRTQAILPEWIFNRVRSQAFVLDVCEGVQGVVYPAIRPADVRRHELPIPPAREQRRIVDAIDSYLTRLDDAVANLERVQAKLAAYRASVLKAAVEGRLVPTEASLARAEKRDYESVEVLLARILKERRCRWEESELGRLRVAGKTPKDDKWKARYREPAAPNASKLPDLPEGWCWASLDQLLHLLRNGQSMAPREDSGVRTLRISAVRPLSVDFQDVRFLPGAPRDYQDDLVEVGDLLFTRYNGTPSLVGVCGRVRVLTEPTVHPDKLIKVRLCSDLHVPYVELAANVGESRRLIENRTRTTAGQAGISGSDLKQMPIPLPPLSEQIRIGDEVERLISVADETKAAVAVDQRRCTRLRQSTLKWAFEGKLVDQGPNDEPAESLLARIRAERAVAVQTHERRGRKAKKTA
jgi:type I restriction enzyme S subunit